MLHKPSRDLGYEIGRGADRSLYSCQFLILGPANAFMLPNWLDLLSLANLIHQTNRLHKCLGTFSSGYFKIQCIRESSKKKLLEEVKALTVCSSLFLMRLIIYIGFKESRFF